MQKWNGTIGNGSACAAPSSAEKLFLIFATPEDPQIFRSCFSRKKLLLVQRAVAWDRLKGFYKILLRR